MGNVKIIVDKFLLEDFIEFLITNYDIKSASVRWVTQGTSAPHSFVNRINSKDEPKQVKEIAEEYAKEKGFTITNAFNSDFLNNP